MNGWKTNLINMFYVDRSSAELIKTSKLFLFTRIIVPYEISSELKK
jgi:hypothetical protein